MTRLSWNDTGSRVFEAGLDRGVLYLNSPNGSIDGTMPAFAVDTVSEVTFNFSSALVFHRNQEIKISFRSDPTEYFIGTVKEMIPSSTIGSGWIIKILITEDSGDHTLDGWWDAALLNTAVVWNGLTGVDEKGAESAATYYIDGRPFLFLPKPKEFSASIKAYTYPDEFAYIQGLAEVTDGMFLDSQPADSFSLSYRTKVGNDLQGIDLGYKIHIIYNATVTPQGISNQTLSEQINPLEFSWDIQAIPVLVDGYRPTAHIVIDTRRMEPDKLAEIEGILYGTETTSGYLPDPQTIFDVLTYGDAIIITDLGDGTWTAEGSYKNIYMIGDGVFQIDNVNAVDHGDGTYTVSSTP